MDFTPRKKTFLQRKIKKFTTKFNHDAQFKLVVMLMILNFSGNIFNYLFHFVVGRMLGPTDYGVVGSLLSILMILTIPAATIKITLTKFASKLMIFGKKREAIALKNSLKKDLLFYAVPIFFVVLLIRGILSKTLEIDAINFFFVAAIFFIQLLTPLEQGILSGFKKFKLISFSGAVGFFLKFILSLIFVAAGMKVKGVLFAILIAFSTSYLINYLPVLFLTIKQHESFLDLFKINKIKQRIHKSSSENLIGLYKYSLPVAISIASLTLLVNIDILLVKLFFAGEQAGYYIAASTLSKIIIFLSTTVANIMFTDVARLHALARKTKNLLSKALKTTFLLALIGAIGYIIFSKLNTYILYGKDFMSAAPFISLFSIVALFYAMISIIVIYALAIENYSIFWALIPATILQPILIFIYHPTVKAVLNINIFINIALFLTLWVIVRNKHWFKDKSNTKHEKSKVLLYPNM